MPRRSPSSRRSMPLLEPNRVTKTRYNETAPENQRYVPSYLTHTRRLKDSALQEPQLR